VFSIDCSSLLIFRIQVEAVESSLFSQIEISEQYGNICEVQLHHILLLIFHDKDSITNTVLDSGSINVLNTSQCTIYF